MLTVAALTPSLDLTYTVDTLSLGTIHRVPEVVRCAGGKALNMARAATQVGADCAVVAILGGPTGAALEQLLRTEGLPVTVVESPAETRICVSIAATQPEQLTEVYQEAAPVPGAVYRRFLTEVERLLAAGPGWLSVSGRAPVGLTVAIADLVRLGRRTGAKVAVDSSGAALGSALAARPDLVKINRSEAAAELGSSEVDDLLTMAEALAVTSGAIVVLTDGTAGALALDGELAVHAAAPGAPGRYPVGSGDSFLGGLLAGLDRGEDLPAALRLATASAVANAQTPGPGQFAPDTVTRVAADVVLRTLS